MNEKDFDHQIELATSFFENPVVLHCEKESYFQYNYELTHSTALDDVKSAKNNENHPIFDPCDINPANYFLRGNEITVNRPQLELLTTDVIKSHIGLLKPYDSQNGTRWWMMSGNQLIAMISFDGKEFYVYNPLTVNSKSRYFLIKENDNTVKFTIKSLLNKINGAMMLFSDIYTDEKCKTFEWFFKSIVVTGGYPPVLKNTFGFYSSLFQHPQFLFLFAITIPAQSIKIDIIEAWYSFSHDSFPTLLPSLIITFLSNNNPTPSNLLTKSLIGHVIQYVISKDLNEILPIKSAKANLAGRMTKYIRREWSAQSRFIFYILLHIYKKSNSEKYQAEAISQLFFGKSPDSSIRMLIVRFVTIYSVFPVDYQLSIGCEPTLPQASTVITAVFQFKDEMLKSAESMDFKKVVENIEKIYESSDYAILTEFAEETDTSLAIRRKSVIIQPEMLESVQPRAEFAPSYRSQNPSNHPRSVSLRDSSEAPRYTSQHSPQRKRTNYFVSSATDFSYDEEKSDNSSPKDRLPKPPKEAIEGPLKTLSDDEGTNSRDKNQNFTDDKSSSKVLNMETDKNGKKQSGTLSEDEDSHEYVLSSEDEPKLHSDPVENVMKIDHEIKIEIKPPRESENSQNNSKSSDENDEIKTIKSDESYEDTKSNDDKSQDEKSKNETKSEEKISSQISSQENDLKTANKSPEKSPKSSKDDESSEIESIGSPMKLRKKLTKADYLAYSSSSSDSDEPVLKKDDDFRSDASNLTTKSKVSVAETPDPVSLDTNDDSPAMHTLSTTDE